MQDTSIPGLTALPADLLTRSADHLRMRAQAAAGTSGTSPNDELKHASQEFESLFIAYLLKTMRETVEESNLGEGDGFGKGIYTELFDQEVSRSIAKHGALGISDLLLKRLGTGEPEAAGSKSTPKENSELPSTPTSELKPSRGSEELSSDLPDFSLPIHAQVTSKYGLRRDPFNHQVKFHKGIDLAAPEGMDVQAALGGEVVFAGYENGYGNTVVLRHAEGLQTRYAHLATMDVRTGDLIAAQAKLGTVGNSGRSTGPHLHFEVTRNGKQIDPGTTLAERRRGQV